MFNPCVNTNPPCSHSYSHRITTKLIESNLDYLRSTCALYLFYFDSWINTSKEIELDSIIDVLRHTEYFIVYNDFIVDSDFLLCFKNVNKILSFIDKPNVNVQLVRRHMLCHHDQDVLNCIRYTLKYMYPEVFLLFKPICCFPFCCTAQQWDNFQGLDLINQHTLLRDSVAHLPLVTV